MSVRHSRPFTMKPRLIVIVALLILPLIPLLSQNSSTPLASSSSPIPDEDTAASHDPEAAQLVTRDIDHFWRAYDKAGPNDACSVFQEEYIDKGSIGLRDFVQLRIESACSLANWVARHPFYYASIRPITQRVSSFTPQMRQSFRKLKELYPAAVFPNVYFVVGRMNSGGTTSYNGLLIGVEMYGRTPDMPISELTNWHKAILLSMDKLPGVVAHELVHFQQNEPKSGPLLAQSIYEGSADFVGELISGQYTSTVAYEYGEKHERELWAKFRQMMHGLDASDWLYNGDNAKDRPADLGYYIGFKIAQAYYAKAADKTAAIRDILQTTDYDHLLTASGYAEHFGKSDDQASVP